MSRRKAAAIEMTVYRHINSQEDSEYWRNEGIIPLEEDCEKHEAISAYLELRNIESYLENKTEDGKRYRRISDWSKDITEAIKPIITLANDGDLDACLLASNHYVLRRFGLKPDQQKELLWMVRAAETGHPDSMYQAAILYFDRDTPSNIEHGETWLKRAAECGDKRALRRITHCCADGLYFPKDVRQAIRYAYQRYKLGDSYVTRQIAQLYMDELKDMKRGLMWLHFAARKRDIPSYISLYHIYDDKSQEIYSPIEAFKWLSRYTEAKPYDTDSKILMARHYRDGTGIPQSRSTAIKILEGCLEQLSDKKESNAYSTTLSELNDIHESLF